MAELPIHILVHVHFEDHLATDEQVKAHLDAVENLLDVVEAR